MNNLNKISLKKKNRSTCSDLCKCIVWRMKSLCDYFFSEIPKLVFSQRARRGNNRKTVRNSEIRELYCVSNLLIF